MIAALSPSTRRALALGLLVALVLAAAAAVALPVVMVREGRAELASVERRIAQLTARLPARERLLDEERVLAEDQPDRILLRGSTPAVAAAQLQGDLSALAAAMGGEIVTIQILEAEETPPFVRVGLRLTMTGDTATMRDFLYAIETRNPVLIVRGVNLSARSPEMADVAADPTLNASLEIYGFAPRSILR